MSRFSFLDHQSTLYQQHLAAWQREERRLYGGDAVLSELLEWKGEDPDFYTSRQSQAGYITLPKNHTGRLVGHLSGATQLVNFNFAELGEVRRREEIDEMSQAEMLWYNVGIGQDGSELIPWFDGVNERAMATHYRWILMEMPTRAVLRNIRIMHGRDPDAEQISGEDEQQGFRPYPVEYGPTKVPFFQYTNDRLDFAVIRIPVTPETLVDAGGSVVAASTQLGYYLLVRRGFTGLGAEWSSGGWWKFTSNQDLVDSGNWDDTDGQIPFFQLIGEPSPGTDELPAVGRSLTMELGQIAISLMNRISERNWNMMQAAKSENWILGIDPDGHAKVVKQQDLGSITIGVPLIMGPDGRAVVPQMWNSSAALLDASAFEMVIRSGLEEAREIMVNQVTSAPDSSGISKDKGFAEANSPLLRRLAGTRQGGMNNLLYFYSLRSRNKNPQASVTIPREFKLAPIVDEIDSGLRVLKGSWLRSVSLETKLVMDAMEKRGLLPEDKTERDKIKKELEESALAQETEARSPLDDDEEGTPGRQAPKAEPTDGPKLDSAA